MGWSDNAFDVYNNGLLNDYLNQTYEKDTDQEDIEETGEDQQGIEEDEG